MAHLLAWLLAACDGDGGQLGVLCADAEEEGVVPGSVTISAYQDVRDLSGCTSIQGDLTISRTDDVRNLKGLEALKRVEGSLIIEGNTQLLSLTGLNHISSVRDLYIEGNPRLRNLEGLDGVTAVRGNILIGRHNENYYCRDGDFGDEPQPGNDSLESLDGLEKLTSLDGDLLIGGACESGNPKLASIAALEGLEEIGTLVVWGAPALQSLEGLHNVKQVDSANLALDAATSLDGLRSLHTVRNRLRLEGNDKLATLDGLNALTRVGGDLSIGHRLTEWESEAESTTQGGNPALKNLQGLNNLKTIGGRFEVAENAKLATLEGIGALTTVGPYTDGFEPAFDIESNPALATLSGLASLSTIDGSVSIANNAQLMALGLDSVTSVTGGLEIHRNPLLPDEEAQSFARRLDKECSCSELAP